MQGCVRVLGGSLRGGGEGGAKVTWQANSTALVQPVTFDNLSNRRSDAVDNPFGAPDFLTRAALVSISRPNSINCYSTATWRRPTNGRQPLVCSDAGTAHTDEWALPRTHVSDTDTVLGVPLELPRVSEILSVIIEIFR
jgi:hypothetical protein